MQLHSIEQPLSNVKVHYPIVFCSFIILTALLLFGEHLVAEVIILQSHNDMTKLSNHRSTKIILAKVQWDQRLELGQQCGSGPKSKFHDRSSMLNFTSWPIVYGIIIGQIQISQLCHATNVMWDGIFQKILSQVQYPQQRHVANGWK
jgi:hypothetical protein